MVTTTGITQFRLPQESLLAIIMTSCSSIVKLSWTMYDIWWEEFTKNTFVHIHLDLLNFCDLMVLFIYAGANAMLMGEFTSAPFLLDNVNCVGNETSLEQCEHDTTHDCDSNEKAGVTCIGMTKYVLYRLL